MTEQTTTDPPRGMPDDLARLDLKGCRVALMGAKQGRAEAERVLGQLGAQHPGRPAAVARLHLWDERRRWCSARMTELHHQMLAAAKRIDPGYQHRRNRALLAELVAALEGLELPEPAAKVVREYQTRQSAYATIGGAC